MPRVKRKIRRRRLTGVDLNISIPYHGGIYEDTKVGALIIKTFGRPDGHGVGFGYEDFSYYGVPEDLARHIKRNGKKVFGRSVQITVYKPVPL